MGPRLLAWRVMELGAVQGLNFARRHLFQNHDKRLTNTIIYIPQNYLHHCLIIALVLEGR